MPEQNPNILLLQGPLGPFLADLAIELRAHGFGVFKINLNKGDWHYALADHVENFHGRPEAWREFLADFIAQNKIDAVVVYGDSRFYHREAREVCGQKGIRYFALEEGYVRPGFVTFEEGGNNANSTFSARFLKGDLPVRQSPVAVPVGNVFLYQFWFAIMYYVVKDWRFSGFRNRSHHRHGNFGTEMTAWVIAAFKKYISRFRERGLVDHLLNHHSGNLFVVPLQVAVDSQIVHHSRFGGMPDFLNEVLTSFAHHAEDDAHLVIKHHPMDRGFHHYGLLIRRLAHKLGIGNRVTYGYDLDLDRLLGAAAGCVTVNSTVGMTALEAGVPTVMLGKAMAVDAGLAYPDGLDSFWYAPGQVDKGQVQAFRHALICETQIPGSFYKMRHIAANAIAARLASVLMLT